VNGPEWKRFGEDISRARPDAEPNCIVSEFDDTNTGLAFFEMNIEEALTHLFNENEEFKQKAKERNPEGNKLRSYRGRYNSGKLGLIASINLLIDFGYLISVKKPGQI